MRFLLAAQKQNSAAADGAATLVNTLRLVALVVFAMAAVMPWAEHAWA